MFMDDGELSVTGGMVLIGLSYLLGAAILWIYRGYERRKGGERREQQAARDKRLRDCPVDEEAGPEEPAYIIRYPLDDSSAPLRDGIDTR